MSEEKQIEEMAKVIEQRCNRDCIPSCDECIAQTLYNAGYRKQSEGKWIEHPHYNYEGGYSGANYECSNCHFDDCYEETPYCPNCGAKMKGGE